VTLPSGEKVGLKPDEDFVTVYRYTTDRFYFGIIIPEPLNWM